MSQLPRKNNELSERYYVDRIVWLMKEVKRLVSVISDTMSKEPPVGIERPDVVHFEMFKRYGQALDFVYYLHGAPPTSELGREMVELLDAVRDLTGRIYDYNQTGEVKEHQRSLLATAIFKKILAKVNKEDL